MVKYRTTTKSSIRSTTTTTTAMIVEHYPTEFNNVVVGQEDDADKRTVFNDDDDEVYVDYRYDEVEDDEDDDVDDDDDEEEEFDDEIIDHEEETRVAKAMVDAVIARKISSDDLRKFLKDDFTFKEPVRNKRRRLTTTSTATTSTCSGTTCTNVVEEIAVASVDTFLPTVQEEDCIELASNEDEEIDIIGISFGLSSFDDVPPDQYLKELLSNAGMKYQVYPARSIPNEFFTNVSEEGIVRYDTCMNNAIAEEDIVRLREMMNDGYPMLCGNKFGETVLHKACRRNSESVLRFFLCEANVSVKVICDNGRSPLHDACWTVQPNWNIISLLLDTCPDLLYIQDHRNFTPLAYVRKEHWNEWNDYLRNRGVNELLPKEIIRTFVQNNE